MNVLLDDNMESLKLKGNSTRLLGFATLHDNWTFQAGKSHREGVSGPLCYSYKALQSVCVGRGELKSQRYIGGSYHPYLRVTGFMDEAYNFGKTLRIFSLRCVTLGVSTMLFFSVTKPNLNIFQEKFAQNITNYP